MMASIRRTVAVLLACTCVAVLVAATTSAASPTPVHLRGVRPGDVALYSGAQFECRDKSGVLPANQINDDYCDCADGSDEPGTSACAQSTFFCRNKGATALTLPASRVRDGVCDCCDGTDEMHADGTTPCANTCAEAGRAVREARAAELVSVEAGLTKRGELVTAAAEALAEKRAKLAKYDSLLVQRRALLEEARQVMAREEALEQEERNRRAEADRIRREAEAAAAAAAAPTEASTATDAVATEATQAADAPASAEQAATPQTPDAPAETATEQQEATKENFPYPQEYAFNPEEAAKQDAAEPAAEQPKENFPYPQEYAFNQEAADEAAASEEEQSAEAETIQPTYTDNVADTTADGAPKNLDNRKPTAVSRHVNQFFESVLPHIQSAKDAISVFVTALAPNDLSGTLLAVAETVGWNILDCIAWLEEKTLGTERVWETFGDRPIRPVSTTSSTSAPATTEAASSDGLYVHPGARDARANVDALSDKVTSLERKAADLRKVVDSSDYGAEYQFYHLDGQCYELKVKQYTYEVCPFSKAAQKEGHGSTSLGSWKGVERDEKTGRIVMKFSGGQTCWNGPQRSLTVALQCGATDELLAVEEPSKCVYEITMRTPAVCTAEQALELRRALEGEQEGENEHAHNKEDL